MDKEHPKFVNAVQDCIRQRAKVSNHRTQSTSAYLRYKQHVLRLDYCRLVYL